jgi:DNA-binding ferritin-like protein (Dps family)
MDLIDTIITDFSSSDKIKNTAKAVTMNEAGMDTLAQDTMQLALLANDYLNKIIDIMNGTKEYFQCEAGDDIRRRFSELSADFPTVVQNIENYAYSLKKAKINKVQGVQDAIIDLKKATANVRDLIKNQ